MGGPRPGGPLAAGRRHLQRDRPEHRHGRRRRRRGSRSARSSPASTSCPSTPPPGRPSTAPSRSQIAQRPFAPNAEENSTIAWHDGYYYLFLSWDYCCRSVESDYRTVVGRSTSLTGPYVDADGVPLLGGKGGTEVLRGYNEFVGAGGGDLLMDKNGTTGLLRQPLLRRDRRWRAATERPHPDLGSRRLAGGQRADQPEPLDRPRRRVRPGRPPRRHGRRRERGLRLRGREHRALDRPRQRVPAVAALRPRDRHPDPQQVQQQRRRGRRVPERRRRQRRAVGLARLPPEQRLPALELLGGGRRMDDGREHPARQPRLDGPGRPGRGQQRRDQHADRECRPAVPVRAGRRRAAGEPDRARRRPWVPTSAPRDRRTAPR